MEKSKRIAEFDFIKGVLISLMVLFHFTIFAEKYGYLTELVYCFHMSGFLLLSGYLQRKNVNIIKSVKKILIPYVVFEIVYLIGLNILGSILGSENKASFTISFFLDKLLISPVGTYWYLHTLFICVGISYIVSYLIRVHEFIKLLIFGSVLFILTLYIDGLKWENIIYFLIGCFIQRSNLRMNELIIPSLFSIIPILLIAVFSDSLHRGNLSGIGLTLFVISFLWSISAHVPFSCRKILCFLGRNSLGIVLFSPIFTVLTKQYISYFNFDSSHILYAIISLIIVIVLCLLAAWICDILKISQYLMGNKIYSRYE